MKMCTPPKLTMRIALAIVIFLIVEISLVYHGLYAWGFSYIPSHSKVIYGNYPATVLAYKVENYTVLSPYLFLGPLSGDRAAPHGVTVVQHQDDSNHTVTCRLEDDSLSTNATATLEDLRQWHPANETLTVRYMHRFGKERCFVANNDPSGFLGLSMDDALIVMMTVMGWVMLFHVLLAKGYFSHAFEGFRFRKELQEKKVSNAYDNGMLNMDLRNIFKQRELLATFKADAEENV